MKRCIVNGEVFLVSEVFFDGKNIYGVDESGSKIFEIVNVKDLSQVQVEDGTIKTIETTEQRLDDIEVAIAYLIGNLGV